MGTQQQIKYCNHCSANISLLIPEGDNRERYVCETCGQIQYQNPNVVCGCIAVWQERILLCRRAIAPRKGLWTLPAGFMENGETIQHGAARETMEEAGAELVDQTLYGLYSLPRINQVYIMFRAQLTGEKNFSAGIESLEVRLFKESEIPWPDIAFRVIHLTMERYFYERKSGNFTVAVQDIV